MLDWMREIISQSEPLLLFLVIGLGFLLGQIRIHGFKLGMAGVLFAGLMFGGWRPGDAEPLTIASQVMQLGLILFVYTVGLTSGASFFASLKTRGLRFNVAIILALVTGGAATLGLGQWIGLEAGQIAGVYCGGLTNTPALAAVTELITNTGIGDPRNPTVAYSMAYPFGIVGGMLAFTIFQWVYRHAASQEKAQADIETQMKTELSSVDFEIRNPALFNKPIGALRIQDKTGLIVSRQSHGGKIDVPTKYSVLYEGDIVSAVGSAINIKKAEEYFGARSEKPMGEIGGTITIRRVLVSKKELCGKTIGVLGLDRKFNAQVTRLRRADIDIVPDHHTIIQLGDRVRVVMPTDRATEVTEFFGDSERGISELDYTALTLGISIGVLIGMIPIPIPGGSFVSLGFAGGPLVAGLILGKLGRTGLLTWALPAESNNAIRHVGLLLFLAAVGVMAGSSFFTALSGDGWRLFTLGLATTTITTGLTLLLLRYLGKASIVSAIGATSGMQTQPATLARAYEMSNSDETYIAYATTYPISMVGKILIAQMILLIAAAMR